MVIPDLKTLKKVLKLCRDHGVSAIEVDGIKLNIALLPKKQPQSIDFAADFPEANIKIPQYNGPNGTGGSQGPDTITTDELTSDQLLFYSAKSEPGQDNPQ